MSFLSRWWALAGVAFAQLRHEKMRTVLAILGVALAVLASVLLVSVGFGVVETGQQKFDESGRDLWVTGGPIELQPASVGGFENSLVGAHEVAGEMARRDGVGTAVPLAFQTVYASNTTSDFQTIVAVGGPGHGGSVQITDGEPFQTRQDVHYDDGNYSGPMTYEALLNERAAEILGVEVGDTIHVGGTLAAAREHGFTVVGISPTYSQFVGSPTVTLHLSELQELVGTTASDRATFITIATADGADVTAVKSGLEREYAEYSVRTNREQLESTVERQALVIVSGLSLAALAVVAGVLLLVNLQLSFVFRRRDSFGALKAIGTSFWSLLAIVGVQTVTIGILGGLLGTGLAVPSLWALNYVAAALTGFEGVVSVSQTVLVGGFVVAIAVSILGGCASGLYLTRVRVLAALDAA